MNPNDENYHSPASAALGAVTGDFKGTLVGAITGGSLWMVAGALSAAATASIASIAGGGFDLGTVLNASGFGAALGGGAGALAGGITGGIGGAVAGWNNTRPTHAREQALAVEQQTTRAYAQGIMDAKNAEIGQAALAIANHVHEEHHAAQAARSHEPDGTHWRDTVQEQAAAVAKAALEALPPARK